MDFGRSSEQLVFDLVGQCAQSVGGHGVHSMDRRRATHSHLASCEVSTGNREVQTQSDLFSSSQVARQHAHRIHLLVM